MLTYRIPRGLGFVSGRSFCDNCKKSLPWYYNVPLLSYVLLKARSGCCGKSISIRYPLIELTTLIGSFLVLFFSPGVIYLLVFYLTFTILVIDLENQIIPDELSFILFILYTLFFSGNLIYQGLFTGIFYSLIFLLIYFATKGKGMGLGDVKLVVVLGMWFSLYQGLIWLTLSFVLGGLYGIVIILLRMGKLKTKVAFGPFLIFAFWVVVFSVKYLAF